MDRRARRLTDREDAQPDAGIDGGGILASWLARRGRGAQTLKDIRDVHSARQCGEHVLKRINLIEGLQVVPVRSDSWVLALDDPFALKRLSRRTAEVPFVP